MDTEESNRDWPGVLREAGGRTGRKCSYPTCCPRDTLGSAKRRVSAGAEQGKLGSAKRGRMDTEENREEPYTLQGLSYFLPYL